MGRPRLEALIEQQNMLTAQQNQLHRQAALISKQAKQIRRQEESIKALGRGVQSLAQMAGPSVEQKVASFMLHKADSQNPAQPVPEPPAVPPTQTTQEVKAPEAFGNVQAPGLVPGSTNDVAADATTTAYTPGMDIPSSAFKNLVDVTAPVDGTQNPRPLEEVRTLTDVRVGDPMNPATAFPMQGEFAQQQRTSSLQEDSGAKALAALQLAELRINAGMVSGDKYAITNGIEKQASLGEIQAEIKTLQQVAKTARRTAPTGLVPKSAGKRSPSLQATPQLTSTAASTFSGHENDDDLRAMIL